MATDEPAVWRLDTAADDADGGHAFDYDVIVIGGGSGGVACAKEFGLNGTHRVPVCSSVCSSVVCSVVVVVVVVVVAVLLLLFFAVVYLSVVALCALREHAAVSLRTLA